MPKIPDNYEGKIWIKIIKINTGIYYNLTIEKLSNKNIQLATVHCVNNSIYLYPGNNLFIQIYYCETDDIYESVEGDGYFTYLIKFIDLSN